ncbi:hypothetical protein BY996DRAFT_6576310 [Phakopsora pachyrhizi]|nr:hypothetical protein BY996DRAFT_6576310 [Phakopsora pachyrhizi]
MKLRDSALEQNPKHPEFVDFYIGQASRNLPGAVYVIMQVYNLKDFCVEVLEAVCDTIRTSTASTAKSLRLNTAANSIYGP